MIIRGNGVELTSVEADDQKTVLKITSDPTVNQYLFGCPSNKIAHLHCCASSEACCKNAYYFAVRDKAKMVGICAYRDIDYRNGSVTVWAAIDAKEQKKAYKAAAFQALARNAFDNMRMEHIAFYCIEGDEAAASSAKSAGFTFDALLYSRIREGDKSMNLELYTLLKDEAVF